MSTIIYGLNGNDFYITSDRKISIGDSFSKKGDKVFFLCAVDGLFRYTCDPEIIQRSIESNASKSTSGIYAIILATGDLTPADIICEDINLFPVNKERIDVFTKVKTALSYFNARRLVMKTLNDKLDIEYRIILPKTIDWDIINLTEAGVDISTTLNSCNLHNETQDYVCLGSGYLYAYASLATQLSESLSESGSNNENVSNRILLNRMSSTINIVSKFCPHTSSDSLNYILKRDDKKGISCVICEIKKPFK
jgi:hypothetical protein